MLRLLREGSADFRLLGSAQRRLSTPFNGHLHLLHPAVVGQPQPARRRGRSDHGKDNTEPRLENLAARIPRDLRSEHLGPPLRIAVEHRRPSLPDLVADEVGGDLSLALPERLLVLRRVDPSIERRRLRDR